MVDESTRRRVLAVAGVGLAGIAGCGGPAEDGDEEGGGDAEDGGEPDGGDEEGGGYSFAAERRGGAGSG